MTTVLGPGVDRVDGPCGDRERSGCCTQHRDEDELWIARWTVGQVVG